jgi:hypothetical protein
MTGGKERFLCCLKHRVIKTALFVRIADESYELEDRTTDRTFVGAPEVNTDLKVVSPAVTLN